jgi:hypothetical protein
MATDLKAPEVTGHALGSREIKINSARSSIESLKLVNYLSEWAFKAVIF